MAVPNRVDRSGVTGTPAECSRWPKPATILANRSSSARMTEPTPLTAGADQVPATQARPSARATSWSSRYFSTDPSVRSTDSRVERADAEQHRRIDPVDRLGDARRLLHVDAPQPLHRRGDLLGQLRRRLGDAQAHDARRVLEVRVVDPVVEAPALEGVVQVAGAVRREDDDGRHLRAQGADLRHGDRRLREHLEEEGLELLVGAVHLVDQQHGGLRAGMLERLQQRPLDEVLAGEERLLLQARALGLGHPDAEQLARVVPLVEGLGRIDALEALQPDERRAQHAGQRLGGLGLADARLALEQQRLGKPHGAEQRRGQALLGEVVVLGELRDERVRIGDLLGEAHGGQAPAYAAGSARKVSLQPGQQK